MEKLKSKELRVVRVTARMVVFTDGKDEFFASRRVANELLAKEVEDVFVVSRNFFRNGDRHTVLMLATPSCW